MSAFYQRTGDRRFVATELTRGPWNNQHQHAGPPTALLASALETHEGGEFALVRVTLELLRPIPLGVVEIAGLDFGSRGKTVQRIQATLVDDTGQELIRASGVRIRRREVALPPAAMTVAAPAPFPVTPPSELPSFSLTFFQHEIGYHRAVEVRYAKGTWGDNQVLVWARPLVSLVEGTALTPTERVFIIADAESGLCPPVDPMTHTFVNPDLTVYLERPLEGEWVGLAARSNAHASGVGIAESMLFDERGAVGRSAQSLVVSGR